MPEAAIRSSASAKGRIKVRTSSGIEGDRSLSKSAINRPRGNSLITKSLDSSQKISMMFKKLSVASCFSRRPSPKHAKNTSAPPPTTLRPITHPSRFASRTNAPYWKSGISAMGLRCRRGWVPRVARRVRPPAQKAQTALSSGFFSSLIESRSPNPLLEEFMGLDKYS